MRLRLSIIAFFTLTLLFSAFNVQAKSPKGSEKETLRHEVKQGDSLDKIAKNYGVHVEDIVRWNNLKSADQIRKGQSLKIRVLKKNKNTIAKNSKSKKQKDSDKIQYQNLEYTVKKGDSLSKIAKKHKISVQQLQKWNKNLKKNPNGLRVGQKIIVAKNQIVVPKGSGSYGTANKGRLSNGIQLESSKGFFVRNPSRAYGTALTVSLIQDVMAKYAAKFPKGPRFAIGDLSAKNGGPLKPHLSHQSGRDVDISYVQKNNVEYHGFARMNKDNFDVDKNWFVIKQFLLTGSVQYIFMDYPLQALIYERALKDGYSQSQLRYILQYPNGKSSHFAVIRHAKGHNNHMHIRFVCPASDIHCH